MPVRLVRFGLLVACLVAASACGSGNTTQGSGGTPVSEPAATVTLFAAASTARVMASEIGAFENRHPSVKIDSDYEGTQALLTKLEADPTAADVFLSADRRHMDEAIQKSLVASPRDVAANRLVVVLPPGNPGNVSSLADLARPGLHIDLADPSVPAGSYALQALQSIEAHGDAPAGFANAVQANVVSRESDVEQVVTKVGTGVVDAGIVYTTDAHADTHLGTLQIPAADQPATVYPVAVTEQARSAAAAREFVAFLLSAQGQSILRAAGFLAPPVAQH